MAFWNRKYKDSVFTDLFGSDRDAKKNFIELYNALSGNDFKLNEVELERKIIEQTLYKTFNNDVSWEINGKLIVLVEHQSTVNENMPLRCLEYVTRIYEGIVPVKARYAEKVYKLPNPDFYVVYVGKKELPEEQELRLSDAFYTKDSSKLELVVTVKNCSSSKLLPVVKKCSILKQYCQFIEIVEHNYNKLFPKKSFKKAIEIAMEQGILKDYLDRKSREVINMLCAKYDYKMDIAVKQEEAREEGIAIGMQQGARQKALEVAKSLYSNGVSIKLIAKSLGMTVEQVQEIIEE
ncbi:MAG: Rpn family recombination-promoting nuclease/putative transposase [Treponema sp.]|nr:Rpn family recombination-promoting nuclease/putative transposase [Treponema sp.]